MSAKYSNDDIDKMIKEPKPLPDNYQARVKLRAKRGHKEQDWI